MNKNIDSVAKETFIRFLIRDGFSSEFASKEFDLIFKCGTRDSYLAVSRVGYEKIEGGRTGRIDIFLSFENAYNHADFEVNYVHTA
jgi:hypothetical protein